MTRVLVREIPDMVEYSYTAKARARLSDRDPVEIRSLDLYGHNLVQLETTKILAAGQRSMIASDSPICEKVLVTRDEAAMIEGIYAVARGE